MKKKLKIGITGGIGSGKSYICRMLENEGLQIFYTDEEAQKIMHDDEEVREALCNLIGEGLYNKKNELNKPLMSDFIRKSEHNRKAVADIVHPRVAEAYEKWTLEVRRCAIMECAILIESGMAKYVDKIVVVTASEEVRAERIMKRNHIERKKAIEWIRLQTSDNERRKYADLEICNNENEPIDISPLLALIGIKKKGE